jgi:SOS response regulatory protein OraA/RecX
MRAQKKAEKPITMAALERSAAWHLQRHAHTVSSLRQALSRKVKKAEKEHGPNDNATAWVEALLLRLQEAQILDDKRFTENRLLGLQQRGTSKRMASQKLRQKGVATQTIEQATASWSSDDELDAARSYARRRRLLEKDPQKALQALARQGFSYDTAKKALAGAKNDERTRNDISDA